MPRGAARADEIGGDDRLAVAGLERVEGAERGGHEQRDHDGAQRELARDDQIRERAARRRSGRWLSRRSASPDLPRPGRPSAEGAIGVGAAVAMTSGIGREKRRRASRTCGGLSRRSVG